MQNAINVSVETYEMGVFELLMFVGIAALLVAIPVAILTAVVYLVVLIVRNRHP